jgi:GrpB-like predicted nucleotidyltransferase (UPF0157 family)
MASPVRLVPYDDLWPREFAVEAARIESACEDLPIRVEHIGSTSIPGMPAKPVIDILVGCPANANRAPYVAALRQIGYVHRGNNGIPGRNYFVRGSPRSHQVHLVNWSSGLWRDHVVFRDYLRSHADVARQYEELKRQLAITFADDRRAFSDAKAPFVRAVLRDARRDAARDSARN